MVDNTDVLFKQLKETQNKERIEQVKPTGRAAGSSGGFAAFNLSQPVVKAIRAKGYNQPTPIQRKSIPSIMQGFNLIAMARTGSGKTGAFIIPAVEKLQNHSKIVGARCVILSPTREIAIQTAAYFKAVAKYTDLTFVLITGGNDMENQFERLLLNPDVIIATPGRLMHCIQEANLQLSQVQLVVYDEADRIFELGFAEQIHEIAKRMPKDRQSLLFSATISSDVKDFTLSGIKDYKLVQVDKESKLSDDLKCNFLVVKSFEKIAALLFIMQELIELKGEKAEQTIIFAATRHHVEYLHEVTRLCGFKTECIFGTMDQQVRESRLQLFRQKKFNFLIVTDLAARGIDIPLLQNVIHYDFPPSLKLFIHRAGRTARAGQKGTSYALITNNELAYMHDLSVFVGRKLQTFEEDPNEKKQTESPEYFTFGTLPQKTLDEYCETAEKLSKKNLAIETLLKSMKNSLAKYNRTREEASKLGMQTVRDLNVGVHPQLKEEVDENEEYLQSFRNAVSAYKPKSSCLEIGILKSKDEQSIDKFKAALREQEASQKQKQQKIEMEQKYQSELQLQMEILEKNQIEMRQQQLQNEKKLLESEASGREAATQVQQRLSKKRKAKIEKIKSDTALSDQQKEEQIEMLMMQAPKKRTKLEDFKDSENYVHSERPQTAEARANSSSLWNTDEKNFLEDVTLNLVPDDDAIKNIKGKTAMRWDNIKKRYMLKKVDRDGKVIAEKRNESGKKITNKMKEGKDGQSSIFKKWQQRTHLSLQRTGEMEDSRAIDQAKRANEARKTLKDFKRRHGSELHKGTDARSNETLFDKKKRKFMEKVKQNGEKKPKQQGQGRQYSEKANQKILMAQRPSRSKMIVKGNTKGQTLGKRK